MQSISGYVCCCRQIGKPIAHGDCCCTGICAHKCKIVIIRFFLGLFGLVLGFPPFWGLTFFVSSWFPAVLDPVALFATISACAFNAAGTSIIRLLGPFKRRAS